MVKALYIYETFASKYELLNLELADLKATNKQKFQIEFARRVANVDVSEYSAQEQCDNQFKAICQRELAEEHHRLENTKRHAISPDGGDAKEHKTYEYGAFSSPPPRIRRRSLDASKTSPSQDYPPIHAYKTSPIAPNVNTEVENGTDIYTTTLPCKHKSTMTS